MNQTTSLIQIKMKPYLMKFIRYYIPDEAKLTASHDFAEIVFSLVQNSPKPVKREDGENILTIHLPERDKLYGRFDGRYSNLFVPQEHQERFNRYVEMLLDKEIYDKLDLVQEMGLDKRRNGLKKDTILSVLRRYSITDDELTYDTVVKRQQRYVKSLSTPMNKAV